MKGRQMTKKGYEELKKYEALRLQSYDDATGNPIEPGDQVQGVLTIGWGHTGPDVYPGMRITKEEAEALFDTDTDRFERVVERTMVGANGEVPNNNQFDACVHCAFNIGEPGWAGSSMVRNWKKKPAPDVLAVAESFKLWNRSQGKVNPGLVTRRAKESALFLTPDERSPIGQRVDPPVMPQNVEPPPGPSKSPTVIATAASGAGLAATWAENVRPAVDALDGAVATAEKATTTLGSLKTLLAVFNNGNFLTFFIMTIALGLTGYVLYRVITRIINGKASAK